MTAKKERIVRYTTEELNDMKERGEAGSDWKRAESMQAPHDADADDALEPVRMDWVTTKLPIPQRKAHASIRIDADVLDWFRAQGRGYQTRINAILRSYFEQQTK